MKQISRTLTRMLLAAGCLLGFVACEHAKFRSDESASMPWATPEGFEGTAGSPLGGLGPGGRFPGSR